MLWLLTLSYLLGVILTKTWIEQVKSIPQIMLMVQPISLSFRENLKALPLKISKIIRAEKWVWPDIIDFLSQNY